MTLSMLSSLEPIATDNSMVVPTCAAQNVDELGFTSRDSENRICWWDVASPKTYYWHAHEMLGRGYAFELLDLIHNSDKTEPLDKHALLFIAAEIVRSGHTMSDGLYYGFFGVISEYLITGQVDR